MESLKRKVLDKYNYQIPSDPKLRWDKLVVTLATVSGVNNASELLKKSRSLLFTKLFEQENDFVSALKLMISMQNSQWSSGEIGAGECSFEISILLWKLLSLESKNVSTNYIMGNIGFF